MHSLYELGNSEGVNAGVVVLCFNEAGQELRCADIAEDGGENAVVGDCGQLKRHGNVEEPCEAGGGGKFLAALLMKLVNTAGHDAAAFDVDSQPQVEVCGASRGEAGENVKEGGCYKMQTNYSKMLVCLIVKLGPLEQSPFSDLLQFSFFCSQSPSHHPVT